MNNNREYNIKTKKSNIILANKQKKKLPYKILEQTHFSVLILYLYECIDIVSTKNWNKMKILS